MSAEEFYTLPEGPPWFQLVNGELFMSPSPKRFHQDIVLNLARILTNHVRKTRCGKVYIGPSDVELGPKDVYEPDIYYVSKGRTHILTEQGASGAPDLVIEVLSPSTARLDLDHKRIAYAEAGVAELWIVHPREHSIDVWRFVQSNDAPVMAVTEGDALTTSLLPNLALAVSQVFAE